MARFVDLVLREADLWLQRCASPPRLQSVFFGGGTPSLLPLQEMHRLIDGLRRRFDLGDCTEWTIEANPATLSLDYCRMLGESGVTRLSLGAQSFDRAELAVLERHHDPEDVPRSLDLARAGGLRRLNIDLIYAIPGQSLAGWMDSLRAAIALGTDHLSCYALTYEPNTPMSVRRRLGQVEAAEEALELAMMRAARATLADAGLPAYEISNYAKPSRQCRHNLLYWTGGNYMGLGPSAASHIDGRRWRNRPHLGEWEIAVQGDALPAMDVESLSPRQRAGELAMLLLRLTRGLEFDEFSRRSGFSAQVLFAPAIERMGRAGLIHVADGSIQLSDAGLSVADGVAAEFLAAAAAGSGR